MAASKGSGNMSRGAAGRRSVGAAGGGMPNGAILDDTAQILLQRRQRFDAWKKGYRQEHLKPNADLDMWYSKMAGPIMGEK